MQIQSSLKRKKVFKVQNQKLWKTSLVAAVDKNPAANVEDVGSIPMKIPRAVEQLSPWATTTDPKHCNERPQRE